MYVLLRRVARIWKRGGGFFERVRKVQTTLTRIFIVLESVSHGFLGKLGNSNVLSTQKQVVSKKKKVFTAIETDFSAKIGNLNVFSAQKQVVSKKKKVFTENETDFLAKIGSSNVFSYRITTSTSQLRHPISFEGGLFSLFHQKSASKALKVCDFASSAAVPITVNRHSSL